MSWFVTGVLFLFLVGTVRKNRQDQDALIAEHRQFFGSWSKDYQKELSGCRMERNQAIAHAFGLERGAAVIRKSAVYDGKRREWVIAEDILVANDEMGDAVRIMKGPMNEQGN